MIRHSAVVIVLLIGIAGRAAAVQADKPDMSFSQKQEAILLDANRITNAAERCGYKLDDDKLDRLLRSADIAGIDMETRKQSAALKSKVADDAKSYARDKQTACAAAYAAYGPSGTSGYFLSE